MILGMTPHFTVRVWASPCKEIDRMHWQLGMPLLKRVPVAEIEVDTTDFDGELTIIGHRGLDLIPQGMLVRGSA